jgi:hypothetical protein
VLKGGDGDDQLFAAAMATTYSTAGTATTCRAGGASGTMYERTASTTP